MLKQSCPYRERITIPYTVQGPDFCWQFCMPATVCFVGRNIVLLLTDRAHAFVLMIYMIVCIQAAHKALIGIPIVIWQLHKLVWLHNTFWFISYSYYGFVRALKPHGISLPLVMNWDWEIKWGIEPIDSCAACNWPWRALAFLPLLTSSLLTKIRIINTQLLQ